MICELKKNNLLTEDYTNILLESFGEDSDLITKWSNKNLEKKVLEKCTPSIRKFALSSHFFFS